MDRIDMQILSLLEENARISIAEIGRTVSMTQPAVTERVRRLEEQGVILGYRAVLAPKKLGRGVTTFVQFKTNDCGSFERFCEESPEVLELYRTSGEYNFLMKIATATLEDFAAFQRRCSAYGFSMAMTVLAASIPGKPLTETVIGEDRAQSS
ncbi:Lrp/AsnC family transcriptional regulator [Cohnella nanjingensis]|uniref:Lrp/AsnC family transcriptional regulator n=1 Tax=Cohnella nanjingensis TaxID=1387779 RepID=A0A7X0RSA5_9BACL|nr:Lrp/AsnC family transcriptional regulator [Cohnella nanjingensis]MBB6672779.1 Lrp/AsnC family transcriptional regulator [Cohnella nanjingensis]